MFNPRPEVLSPRGTVGSSSNLQFKAERIKIPSTPRYPRSVVGSDRGENSHSRPCLPARAGPVVQRLGAVCNYHLRSASPCRLVEPGLSLVAWS